MLWGLWTADEWGLSLPATGEQLESKGREVHLRPEPQDHKKHLNLDLYRFFFF